ncbi:DNA excision repair protein ERCC-1 [Histomonas meleagridis]|uniref:DNA excision repair protein ERCC-1 n=1 Tax=Histomonas meleagridis TaxID=135588 RepID=UPI0035594F71|nr:DNA excision repair protein ERCC-1 [Histomonas meleagridis]KAH0799916.1 DNA excision repair protein ERCC-1 [Histomonas meleagridis]
MIFLELYVYFLFSPLFFNVKHTISYRLWCGEPITLKLPITISNRQKGNQLIKILAPAQTVWSDSSTCDYSIGYKIGILFLSLKFHREHPNYLSERIANFKGGYATRILLLVVDGKNPDRVISKLTAQSIANNLNLVLAFNLEEAGRWILTIYNTQESQVDELKATNETTYDIAINALNAIGVSRKDAASMIDSYGTVSDCLLQSRDSLTKTNILSDFKMEQFLAVLDEPFQ